MTTPHFDRPTDRPVQSFSDASRIVILPEEVLQLARLVNPSLWEGGRRGSNVIDPPKKVLFFSRIAVVQRHQHLRRIFHFYIIHPESPPPHTAPKTSRPGCGNSTECEIQPPSVGRLVGFWCRLCHRASAGAVAAVGTGEVSSSTASQGSAQTHSRGRISPGQMRFESS